MQPLALREVVGHFWKSPGKRIYLNSLTVFDGVSRREYDVDFSRRFGYIFHQSGGGGSNVVAVRGIYHCTNTFLTKRLLGEDLGSLRPVITLEEKAEWVDPRDEAPYEDKPRTLEIRKRNRTRRLTRLPKSFMLSDGQDLFDWLLDNGIENESVYCSVCKDYSPDNGWDLCEHCLWCAATGCLVHSR